MDDDVLKRDYCAGMSLRTQEAKYGVPRSTIADRVKKEQRLRVLLPAIRTVSSGHPKQTVRTPNNAAGSVKTGPRTKRPRQSDEIKARIETDMCE
jgi:hypothetical protein